jgi:hypothetical protein
MEHFSTTTPHVIVYGMYMYTKDEDNDILIHLYMYLLPVTEEKMVKTCPKTVIAHDSQFWGWGGGLPRCDPWIILSTRQTGPNMKSFISQNRLDLLQSRVRCTWCWSQPTISTSSPSATPSQRPSATSPSGTPGAICNSLHN